MSRLKRSHPTARLMASMSWRVAVSMVVAATGFATAAAMAMTSTRTFTLRVARHATVTNMTKGTTRHESIVVTSSGRAVYELTGDSERHPECTKASGCFAFWPPVTVSSRKKLSKAPGVKGRLGVWRRNGRIQVTLNGHPLYRFYADTHRHHATGQGQVAFGGTWHVVKASSSGGGSGSTTTTSTSPTTTTTPCVYPPYC